MSFDCSLFSAMRRLPYPAQVRVANDQFLSCNEIGNINLRLIIRDSTTGARKVCVRTFKDVLFVPGIRKNLLSVGAELRSAEKGSTFVADQNGNCGMRTAGGDTIYSGTAVTGSETTWSLDLASEKTPYQTVI